MIETNKKKLKKLSFFIYSLDGGGAERVVVTLANYFVKHQFFEISIILIRKRGVFLNELNPAIDIISLPQKLSRLGIVSNIFLLYRQLKKTKPDILLAVAERPNVIVPFSVWLSGKSHPVDYYLWEHTSKSYFTDPFVYGLSIFTRWLARIAYYKSPIIVVSKGMQNNLKAKGLPLPYLLYNPFEIKKIRRLSRQSISHQWLQEGRAKVIVAAARLTELKDFPNLIKAMSLLKNKRAIKLFILGEGEEKKNLIKLINRLQLTSSIEFMGFVKNPYAYFAKADLFVLSSKYEGFGNTLVEALACGQTIVSTHCPSGPGEILKKGAYGYLVPPEDSTLLAEMIHFALDHPLNKEKLKKRAERFNVENCANKLCKYLAEKKT